MTSRVTLAQAQDHDESSAQLESDLQSAVGKAIDTRRPILHHLNGDTTWLLQIPRPSIARQRSGRMYFNILIDPWLSGNQIDIGWWFSRQWHKSESSTKTIAEVDELLQRIEGLVEDAGVRGVGKGTEDDDEEKRTWIDAIAINHEFSDHCHKETLLQVDKEVPVFAPKEAAKLVKSWKHFRQVIELPVFGRKSNDWRSTSLSPLPDYVGIGRIEAEQFDPQKLHSAVCILFNLNAGGGGSPTAGSSAADDDELAEAVIITPHGVRHNDFEFLASADPPVKTLALLHGLQSVRIAGLSTVNLGAQNGLKSQRILRAKYWIRTHDEDKGAAGIISWMLNIKKTTIEEALQQERQRLGKDKEGKEIAESMEGVNFAQMANGESKVLV